MHISKISSKNQITLPKAMLYKAGIGAGDRVLISLDDDGKFCMKTLHKDPLAYIASRAEYYGRTLARGKKKRTDREISDIAAKIVAKEKAHG